MGAAGVNSSLDSVRIKERPILFSAPMVRAIRDGRKTQTRRALAPADHTLAADILSLCQFGRAGDRLWVREAWAVHKNFDGLPGSAIGMNAPEVWYCSDYDDSRPDPFGRYRHGRFMPRWACRLVLDVVSVRVERLQDISAADVEAEGLDSYSASSVIGATAEKFTTVPEHWIGGHDEGESYCRACAEKKLAELSAANPTEEYQLDGGWRTTGDSQAFCETCTCALGNSFTDYACEQELDHFARNGFDVKNPCDCHSLDEMLSATLWNGGKHSAKLQRLAYRALWDSLNEGRGFGWATNPWVWVIEFKRTKESAMAIAA